MYKTAVEKIVPYYQGIQCDIERIQWAISERKYHTSSKVLAHLQEAINEIEDIITFLLDNTEDDMM